MFCGIDDDLCVGMGIGEGVVVGEFCEFCGGCCDWKVVGFEFVGFVGDLEVV